MSTRHPRVHPKILAWHNKTTKASIVEICETTARLLVAQVTGSEPEQVTEDQILDYLKGVEGCWEEPRRAPVDEAGQRHAFLRCEPCNQIAVADGRGSWLCSSCDGKISETTEA